MTHRNGRYKAADETPDAQGWSYLACTEIVHPIGANNVTDMFPPDNWTIASNDYWCKIKYNISSRPAHIPTQFGLWHQDRFARAHTRILYAYGLRDPWHTLGWPVGNDLAPELPIITIADGSHCVSGGAVSFLFRFLFGFFVCFFFTDFYCCFFFFGFILMAP